MTNSENRSTGFFAEKDSTFERGVTKVAKVLLYIGMVGIIIMMVITVLHGVGRYAFKQPLLGVVSISSSLLAILIFAVGAYTQILKEHVVVGVIVDRLSQRKQAIVDSITYIICLIMLTLAFWQSLEQSIVQMQAAIVTSVLHTPTFIFSIIVALGWGIFSLVILLQLRHIIPVALGRTKS